MAHGPSNVESPHTPVTDSGMPDFEHLARIASWEYPFERATRESAKTSVTAFRKRVADETDGESRVAFDFEVSDSVDEPMHPTAGREMSFADVGIAHHSFLEHVDYGATDDETQLRAQAQLMIERGSLTRDESACLEFPALARFLHSKLGIRIRNEREWVRRELPFTTKVSVEDLDRFLKPSVEDRLVITPETSAPACGEGEFAVVQGVVDLAVIKEDSIWIVDYKTDRTTADRCPEKAVLYAPQMLLYASALEGIYKRPVTECWLYFLNPGVAAACGRMKQTL